MLNILEPPQPQRCPDQQLMPWERELCSAGARTNASRSPSNTHTDQESGFIQPNPTRMPVCNVSEYLNRLLNVTAIALYENHWDYSNSRREESKEECCSNMICRNGTETL